MDYNVRGTTSLSGGAPLFIVDGVPADNINNINPADVETLTVLKDAASAAIYGSRAAFGVILVTTKTAGQEKLTVNYNNNFGMRKLTGMADVITDPYIVASTVIPCLILGTTSIMKNNWRMLRKCRKCRVLLLII